MCDLLVEQMEKARDAGRNAAHAGLKRIAPEWTAWSVYSDELIPEWFAGYDAGLAEVGPGAVETAKGEVQECIVMDTLTVECNSSVDTEQSRSGS